MAVGRRLRHLGRGNRAVGAGLVLHHHRLAKRLAERLRDDAHHDVGRRAGAERHQHADRLARVLCGRRAGAEQRDGED